MSIKVYKHPDFESKAKKDKKAFNMSHSYKNSYIDIDAALSVSVQKIPKKLFLWRFYYKCKYMKFFKNIVIYLDIISASEALNIMNDETTVHVLENYNETDYLFVLIIASDDYQLQTNVFNIAEQKQALKIIITD